MYTRVLKGHIHVCTAIVPSGHPGTAFDAFAREVLSNIYYSIYGKFKRIFYMV